MYDDEDYDEEFSEENFSDWLSDKIFTSEIMAMPDYVWNDINGNDDDE